MLPRGAHPSPAGHTKLTDGLLSKGTGCCQDQCQHRANVPAASTGYVVGRTQAFSIVQAGGHVGGCSLQAFCWLVPTHAGNTREPSTMEQLRHMCGSIGRTVCFRAGACVLKAGVRCTAEPIQSCVRLNAHATGRKKQA